MKDKIVWTPDMSVGVAEIDDQHKQFIGIISDFHDAFNSGKSQELLGDILNRLINYTDFHFNTEEKYFDKFNYEFKDEHKREHEELRKKVLEFKKQSEKEGGDIVVDFSEFMIDWLVNHIEDEDQRYVKCFHDNGLF